jgi:hypothetical protein
LRDLGCGPGLMMRSHWSQGGSSDGRSGSAAARAWAGCCAAWNAKPAGRWLSTPGRRGRTGCSGCSRPPGGTPTASDDRAGVRRRGARRTGRVLIGDDTGFEKGGSRSAGVQRQHSAHRRVTSSTPAKSLTCENATRRNRVLRPLGAHSACDASAYGGRIGRREGRRVLPLAPCGGDCCPRERARVRLAVARVRNGTVQPHPSRSSRGSGRTGSWCCGPSTTLACATSRMTTTCIQATYYAARSPRRQYGVV